MYTYLKHIYEQKSEQLDTYTLISINISTQICTYIQSDKNICINVCIIKIHVPRAHEVENQRVIAKRTSQIMKYGQDVTIQKRTDDNI